MIISATLVALGGALGALARFGVVSLVKPHSPGFPSGTLACNLAGCAVIGLLAGWLSRMNTPTDNLRLFLFAGVLGGFTTFSSLGLEVTEMLRESRFAHAAAYVLLSNAVGIALALAGYALTAR
jgi:CrcB protein